MSEGTLDLTLSPDLGGLVKELKKSGAELYEKLEDILLELVVAGADEAAMILLNQALIPYPKKSEDAVES